MYVREVLPYYAGPVSFFRAPNIEIDEIEEGTAVVAGVPIDNGVVAVRTGARFGPRAIREWSMQVRGGYAMEPERTLFDVVTGAGLRLKDNPRVADIGDFNVYPTDLMKTTESVIEGMTEVVKRGAFALVLGGDHYVAYPSFEGFARGIAERREGARLGYIHIDSHSDFRDDYDIGGRFNHGTCVRRISENPMLSYRNMAWVGLNKTLSIDQVRLRHAHDLKMLTYKDIVEQGIVAVVQEAMEAAADGVDAVYVSVDIDVVDASESPGTGIPEFNGILASEFLDAMKTLSGYPELGALDLCEVSPEWDPTGRTVMLAASGLVRLLGPWLFEPVDMADVLARIHRRTPMDGVRKAEGG